MPVARSGAIYYINFTAVHANGTVDAELATQTSDAGRFFVDRVCAFSVLRNPFNTCTGSENVGTRKSGNAG